MVIVWTPEKFAAAADQLRINRVMCDFANPICGTPCHEWGITREMYVLVNRQHIYVSTLACEVKTGTKQARGLMAYNHCRNDRCIRPEHLSWMNNTERRAALRVKYPVDQHAVRTLFENKYTPRRIAMIFNVNPSLIFKILRGEGDT